MGADARWVCHTCKMVCPRGGRPMFVTIPRALTLQDIVWMKTYLAKLRATFELQDGEDITSFLNDLHSWLGRHFGHDIHIGSDYSTDMMDLGDYRNESVDGKVSDCTRAEAQEKSMEEWAETSIQRIEEAIQGCVKGEKSVRATAEELYNHFSMRDL